MAEYNQVLDTAGKTAGTFGEMAKGINPKNVLALWGGGLMLVVFTIITIWLVKKALGNTAENFFDWLLRPYRTAIMQLKGVENAAKTNTKPTINQDDAKDIANQIYTCFQPSGDDEERFFAIISNKIANAADWELVKNAFGSRICPKAASAFGFHHDGELEHVISHNLSSREKSRAKGILNAKGITPNF